MTNLKLLVFTGILAIALSALCSVPGFGDGTCIETSKCSRAGGKSHKGYCSGKSSIQCCTSVKCGNDGICKKKDIQRFNGFWTMPRRRQLCLL